MRRAADVIRVRGENIFNVIAINGRAATAAVLAAKEEARRKRSWDTTAPIGGQSRSLRMAAPRHQPRSLRVSTQ